MRKITLTDFEKNPVKSKRWLECFAICMTLLLGSFTLAFGQGSTCGAPISITTLPYTHSANTATYGENYLLGDVPAVAP